MATTIPAYAALARGLSELSVEVVFGLLGDGNLAVVDELVTRNGVRFLPVNREDLAVSAADAFSRVSGRLGVASVTHGPGLTNAITALHEAARARSPLIVLCGDTDPVDLAHNQNIDHAATIAPTGAEFVALRSAETLSDDLTRACTIAEQEMRPVVFNLPVDMQEVPVHYSTPRIAPRPPVEIDPDPIALDRSLGLIASARRPLILAGRGAIRADARHHLLGLAQLLHSPVATTLKAKSLFAEEKFNLGVCGTVGSSLSAEVADRADCLIAFGASLNRYTTSYGSLLQGKHVVQVDLSSGAIGRWYPVDAGVVGDAGRVACLMADALRAHGESPPGLSSPELAQQLADFDPTSEFEDESTSESIDPRTLMVWLNRIAPRDRIVVSDVGGFMEIPLRFLDVTHPRAHVLPAAFGSVGLAMGAALGAGVADDTKPVLAVMGDGGWMMGGINGFDAAVREGIDIITVVLNDSGYGIERRALAARGSDSSLASMPWPEPSGVARALGGEVATVKCLDDLEDAGRRIAQRTGPLLLDARIPL